MPMYEYRCTSCGERIEVLQRLGAALLLECPACQGVLEKMISAPALQFKGSGWYVTDYGKGRGRKNGEGESSNESPKKETAPSAPPSTDSKPSAVAS